MENLVSWARKNFGWQVIPFFLITLFFRFFNIYERLYFIWDQGRDAWAIQKIIEGDLVLIGPTSGIQGFFLGPLWFYLGSIGHLLTSGSAFGMAIFYILIGSLSLPLYWLIGKKLFAKAILQQSTAYLLALIPGSIHAATFVWNPLISLPLVAGAYLALLNSHKSRIALGLAFFLLALTLQSEFAYAVFFLGPLFLLIPWLRKKRDWRDFAIAFFAIAITGIPQAIFEIRNKFIMTQSLFRSVTSAENSATWSQVFTSRPRALWDTTAQQLFNGSELKTFGMLLVIFIIGYLFFRVISKKSEILDTRYQILVTTLLVVIPYAFFMLWRGNNGAFFDYYITPHFTFLIPLIMLGVDRLFKEKWLLFKKIPINLLIIGLLSIVFAHGFFQHVNNTVFAVDNQAGMKVMQTAVDTIYDWQRKDNLEQATVRIFTPNRNTEHYDYLFFRTAKDKNLAVPLTQRNEETETWYVLIEPDHEYDSKVRLNPWLEEVTMGGEKIRELKSGVLILETWQKQTSE